MGQPGRVKTGLCRWIGRMLISYGCLAAMASVSIGGDQAAPVNPAKQVTNHLEAGEFGLAMAQALAAAPQEQTALLKQIADAQAAAGDQAAAQGTLRRTARTNPGINARPDQTNLSGGGMGLMQLVRLIQQSTPGKWEDEGGEGGRISTTMGMPMGVKVSPEGLLQRVASADQSGQLSGMSLRARKADLNQDISQASALRMVSLTRLERAVARRIEEGQPVTESMSQLAGLSQVKYVFVFPEAQEVVVAGPANAWHYNAQGQPISMNDGRPTLQLDDLVTVLRTFASGETHFGCSINTRDENVKNVMQFVEASNANGPLDSSMRKNWLGELQKRLGRQDVVVWGVPGDSRVARVIVEADYRMKLIGVDKIDAGKDIPSYFDLLSAHQQKNAPAMEALRWWLTLKLDAVLHSPDKSVYEIQGSSVLCQSENQFLTAEGKHVPTGQSEPMNRTFAENFTNNYNKLAAKDLIFADTQNIFDMALCAALIKNQNLDKKASWNMGVFAPGGAYSPASYSVPKEIDSVMNHRVYNQRNIVVQVAGGVTANVMTVATDNQVNKESAELATVGATAKAPELPVGRWWWDVAR